jgi:hypothetical protein
VDGKDNVCYPDIPKKLSIKKITFFENSASKGFQEIYFFYPSLLILQMEFT